MKKQASYKCEGSRETKWEKIIIKLYNKMVWLDGFTQLHLFHGLLDSEILRGTISTTRNLWLLNCITKKAFTERFWRRWHQRPAAKNRQFSTESPDLFTFFSFSLRIQMILRTQLRGSGAFSNVRGRRGRLIVYHAKRIPLLKFPRMSFA